MTRSRKKTPTLVPSHTTVARGRQTYSTSLDEATHSNSNVIDLEEARTASRSRQTIDTAWADSEQLGIVGSDRRSTGTMSDYDRKDTLYQLYENNVWISAPIDVTAKRVAGVDFTIEPMGTQEGTQADYDLLHNFLLRVNPDMDFCQFVEYSVRNELIYGETYAEIVPRAGRPFEIYLVDCQTMSFELDRHGGILKYHQQMKNATETLDFDPQQIIRWWFPSPKANMLAMAPLEKAKNAAYLDMAMVEWGINFFKKGARPPFWIKYPGSLDDAKRFHDWLRENYTGKQNAHKPLIMVEEAELYEIGKGAIDVDFLKGRMQNREEFLAVLHVPPSMVSLDEAAHLGGGSGESQHKAFLYNVISPIRKQFFEKFNYRVVQAPPPWGFGIKGWRIGSRDADFRDDTQITDIQDKRIRNGSSTIDEIRAELGQNPYPVGGNVPVIVTTREITPVPRLDDLEEESRQNAKIAIQTAQANADLAQTKAKQAKEPPKPVPAALAQSIPGQAAPAQAQVHQSQQTPPALQQSPQAKEQALPDWVHSLPPTTDKAVWEASHAHWLAQQNTIHTNADYINWVNRGLPYINAERAGKGLTPLEPFPLEHYIPAPLPQGEKPYDNRTHVEGQEERTPALVALPQVAQPTRDPGHLQATQPPATQSPHATGTPPLATEEEAAPTGSVTMHQWKQGTCSCEACTLNADAVRPHGQAFPSGETTPGSHDECDCTLQEVKPSQEAVMVQEDTIAQTVPDIWEPGDIDDQIAALHKQEVVTLTWHNFVDGTGCAAYCLPNDGESVPTGQAFTSGHRTPPAHPNCNCYLTGKKADGTEVTIATDEV